MKKNILFTIITIAFFIAINSNIFATDYYEPDNDFSSANSISLGASQNRSIHIVGDQDYIYFNISEEVETVIQTSGENNSDTIITLYNFSESQIDEDDNSGEGSFSKITKTLLPGTYYILVAQNGNNSTIPDYNLSVSLVADTFEPDNTYTTAQHLAISTKTEQQHSFHNSYDEDWFHISVPSKTYLIFSYDPINSLSAYLRLYRLVDDNLDYIRSETAYSSKIITELVEPGEYYFNCSGRNSSSLGKYKFTFETHDIQETFPNKQKISFKEVFDGKKEGHHNWKLKFNLPEVTVESLEGVSFVIRMANSNNSETSTFYLPNSQTPDFNKKKNAMTARTIFDFFKAKLSKKGISFMQVMKDTSLGNVTIPRYAFCMDDIETAPSANLSVEIEMWKNNLIYAQGKCNINITTKYTKKTINGKSLKIKKSKVK